VIGHARRQPEQAAADRHEPALDLRQPELRRLGRHDQVAAQCELHPARDRITFDGRNDRFLGRLRHDPEATTLRRRRLLTLEQRFQIHARGEAAARSGQHGHAQRGIFVEAVERIRQR
jgi:hypothetical protein